MLRSLVLPFSSISDARQLLFRVFMSTESVPAPAAPVYSNKNPFHARHLVNLMLTGSGSEKDTRHHEISLEGSGIKYSAGDALGLQPTNCPDLVQELIVALHATGEELVPGRDGTLKPLRTALFGDYAITFTEKKFVEAAAEKGIQKLKDLLQPERSEDLKKYLSAQNECRDYVDILREFPELHFAPEEFVKYLRKMPPRLYSIASSLLAHPDSVHLTVAAVRFTAHGRIRKGVASTFMAERWTGDTTAGIFLQSQQKHFFLPSDGNTPIIMVGPGTGVAPFRAFIEERQALGHKGANWLIFGEQRRAQDFFYEEQFTKLANDGFLRLDTAFSRDQAEKIYVQHRLEQNASDIWKWLEEGAEFFVCGDKTRMAADVDNALHRIVETQGGKTPDEAKEYVAAMKKAKRYKRDVY
ncbi:MAG: FAD-binding domain protein [Chthoniobacteraceae bacterium]|nr:FAD-binding domain protein [Chthoniobacteraceae bacterium]